MKDGAKMKDNKVIVDLTGRANTQTVMVYIILTTVIVWKSEESILC